MAVKNRLFWRVQREGDPPRAYANFRDYADVGGKRKMALIPEGQKHATTDPDIAQRLIAQLLETFEKRRRGRALGVSDEQPLAAYIKHHLETMARGRENSVAWIETSEMMLARAIQFFGANRDINGIGPKDLAKYVDWLRTQKAKNTKRPLSEATIRHHLNVLSGMYSRALSEEVADKNPVTLMYSKPVPDGGEAPWLEVDDAARYLEAARDYRPVRVDRAMPYLYALVATFLLTGARRAEVYGIERDDVSFDRGLIYIRPNKWRGLKTKMSTRVIPLWPQLRMILTNHLATLPDSTLLFPSFVNGKEQMLQTIQWSLNAVSKTIPDWNHYVTTRMFRHTYCAARLQTLDNGKPVTVFTVARELGHTSTERVERVYGHLGEIRYRSDVVEYRMVERELVG